MLLAARHCAQVGRQAGRQSGRYIGGWAGRQAGRQAGILASCCERLTLDCQLDACRTGIPFSGHL